MKQPRWYQEEALQATWNYLREKKGNPLIALPTATGKAFVIADLNRRALAYYPATRILNLTHVHTLVQQNYDELLEIWPSAPASVYSAGLKKKDFQAPIVFGTIQSVHKHAELFGFRDLVTIDEAHMLSPKEDSMYQKALAKLLAINPFLRVIGLSATCYRMGQGMLTEDGLFEDICYDKTQLADFNKFIEDGHLCTLIAKPTLTEYDTEGLPTKRGEFDAKEAEFRTDKHDLNLKICEEIYKAAYDRKSWLIFCTSINHAEHINAILQRSGLDSQVAHSKLDPEVCDKRIEDWKAGRLRCLVTRDMCTTGVNNPRLDFIGMLRLTQSVPLWVQMLGRGTRIYPGKQNCLVLDFAGNVKRLGQINDPKIPGRPGKSGSGSAPVRVCENCGVYNHASARSCFHCGFVFPIVSKLVTTASEAPLIRDDKPHIETYEVKYATYTPHEKYPNPPCVKVAYMCGPQGLSRFLEWVCPEHRGSPRKRARDWWRNRSDSEPPITTADYLRRSAELKTPKKIHVWTNRAYPEIMGVEF
jgi:DNA repair protein RadD